jgi:hypothetical protein
MVDVRNPSSLHYGGWDPGRRSVIIIHGFNETESDTPTTFITKGAYCDTWRLRELSDAGCHDVHHKGCVL